MLKKFELISHTADLQIKVYGKDYNELFTNALNGMFQIIEPKTNNCNIKNEILVCDKLDRIHEVDLTSSQLDLLLVDFLSEALYLSDVNNEAYFDAQIIYLNDTHIKANILGVKVEGFKVEIKAVTYHDLRIEKEDNYFKANIVFDI